MTLDNVYEPTVRERYQFKPFPGSSHSWAIGHLNDLKSTHHRVLDIGPGRGDMGGIAKKLGYAEVDAVEPDNEARAFAAETYGRVVSSLSELSQKPYDLILLLDVLEHMEKPEQFILSELAPFMQTGSKLLISVPNVAHWSLRVALLFGSFEYTDRGLLDRTHLQLFTKKRAHSLMNVNSTFVLNEYKVSIEPVEYFLPERLWQSHLYQNLVSRPRQWLAQCFPGLLGYQHMLLLERR